MTRLALAILLVLAFQGASSPHAAILTAPPASIQRSENGLYSADINSTAPNEIILGVHRHDGDVKVLSWSKRVPWNGANATFTAFPWIKRFISNDGQTVVLHNQQYRNESWVWISKGAEPVRYYPYDFRRVLGQNFSNYPYSHPYLHHSDVLQFISEAERLYALWFPFLDKWLTIDLKTGVLTPASDTLAEVLSTLPSNAPNTEAWLKPPSEDIVSRLNAEAAQRALEAVRKHQPSPIKFLFKPVREKLGALIPGLKPPAQLRLFTLPEAYPAYLFLARHKIPAGENYLRKLLELPFERKIAQTRLGDIPEFTVLSQERMLGDLAWRLWNGIQIQIPPHAQEPFYGALQRATNQYLGSVAGRVRLPMVRPDTKPGALWVYLVPARLNPGRWAKSGDIIPLFCQFDISVRAGRFAGINPFQFDAIDYRFETITPGEYRLKAVWDRRPPASDQDGLAVPEAGDYESAESEPFTIAAGITASGPTLDCTNSVGQADTYYAADAAWKKLNPVPVTRYPSHLPGMAGIPFAYRPPDDDRRGRWIIKTNSVAKNFEFKKAEVIQVLPIGALLERDELIVTFEVKDLTDLSLRKLVPQIRDEHGCLFEATLFVPAPRPGSGEMTVRAGVFPRNKEFTLKLRSATGDKDLASYTIKNGGSAQKAQWHSRPLPSSRPLAGKTVRLTELTRAGGAKFDQLDKKTSTDSTAWTPETVIYQDREGNRSFEADDFCLQENQIKVQLIHQSQTREFIADFTDKP